MQVSVEVRRSSGDDPGRLVLSAADPVSPLVHDAHVGSGVRVGVDLLAPTRWVSVSVDRVDPAGDAVLAALVGERAVRDLNAAGGPPPVLDVDTAGADAWVRVAVVDAVDRWLHLPLDQSLVEAERGVSRMRAAAGLPDGAGRESVLGDALRLARGASAGLVRHIRRLGASGSAVPDALRAGLDRLVEGYGELAAQVRGPDDELTRVLDAWRRAGSRMPDGPFAAPWPADRRARVRREPDPDVVSAIDPRQVPARVLGLSADPATAEVDLSALPGEGAVCVRVPAFGGPVDDDRARRLLVRLVDRRTAEARGHGLLTLSPAPRRHFRATVAVTCSDVTDLRADVYDALSAVPPAPDQDAALTDARRASVFLREWRRLVGAARVTVGPADPAGHLRELAERIRPRDGDPERPAIHGGPSVRDLLGLADAGEDAVRERLRTAGGDGGRPGGPLDSVRGLGRLLVAELAATIGDGRRS